MNPGFQNEQPCIHAPGLQIAASAVLESAGLMMMSENAIPIVSDVALNGGESSISKPQRKRASPKKKDNMRSKQRDEDEYSPRTERLKKARV